MIELLGAIESTTGSHHVAVCCRHSKTPGWLRASSHARPKEDGGAGHDSERKCPLPFLSFLTSLRYADRLSAGETIGCRSAIELRLLTCDVETMVFRRRRSSSFAIAINEGRRSVSPPREHDDDIMPLTLSGRGKPPLLVKRLTVFWSRAAFRLAYLDGHFITHKSSGSCVRSVAELENGVSWRSPGSSGIRSRPKEGEMSVSFWNESQGALLTIEPSRIHFSRNQSSFCWNDQTGKIGV